MDLKQFLELFNPLPGNHYLQVTQEKNLISSELSKILEAVNGELKIELLSENDLLNSKPFRALPRDNDIVILQDVFHQHQNKSQLLKISYRTLANTAEVIIMEKEGVLDIEQTKQILEEYEFRTPNYVDILDGYDIVIAKKMHMWGNGL